MKKTSEAQRIILLIFICMGIILLAQFQAKYKPETRYHVFIDDVSIREDGEVIFQEDFSSGAFEREMIVWSGVAGTTDEDALSPPSCAFLKITAEGYGCIQLDRTIALGWKTLNFSWAVKVPDINWAGGPTPRKTSGIGSQWVVSPSLTLRCSTTDEGHWSSVFAGLHWQFTASMGEVRDIRLHFGYRESNGDMIVEDREVVNTDWEFGGWYRLSLVLDSEESTASLYVDGEPMAQVHLRMDYFREIVQIWWRV